MSTGVIVKYNIRLDFIYCFVTQCQHAIFFRIPNQIKWIFFTSTIKKKKQSKFETPIQNAFFKKIKILSYILKF